MRGPGRRLVVRLGVGASIVVALFCTFVHVASERALAQRFETPSFVAAPCAEPASLASPSADLVERGRHLVRTVAQCTFCHGEDLGGAEVGDDPWIGRVDATNLTRGAGTFGRARSFCEWDRAIRRGLARDGRSLLLMPSRYYADLSDADLAAIVAFLRVVPPVERATRPRRIGPLSRFVTAFGLADDVFSALGEAGKPLPATRDRGSRSPERVAGAHLVDVGLCRVCHKADLRGGLHPLALPGEPEPPPLVGGAAMVGWTRQDFVRAMRTGMRPDGRMLDRGYMPWPTYARLREAELGALWLALRGAGETEPPTVRADRGETPGGSSSRGLHPVD